MLTLSITVTEFEYLQNYVTILEKVNLIQLFHNWTTLPYRETTYNKTQLICNGNGICTAYIYLCLNFSNHISSAFWIYKTQHFDFRGYSNYLWLEHFHNLKMTSTLPPSPEKTGSFTAPSAVKRLIDFIKRYWCFSFFFTMFSIILLIKRACIAKM